MKLVSEDEEVVYLVACAPAGHGEMTKLHLVKE